MTLQFLNFRQQSKLFEEKMAAIFGASGGQEVSP
jgi:hypothetical protein